MCGWTRQRSRVTKVFERIEAPRTAVCAGVIAKPIDPDAMPSVVANAA
jgi:hypothetical protein